MDKDSDQRVDLNEFTDYYHVEYFNLKDEVEELDLRLKD
jgi:hypothetical protein